MPCLVNLCGLFYYPCSLSAQTVLGRRKWCPLSNTRWWYLIMIINVFNLFQWYISIQLKYSSHERDILKRKLEERVGLQLVDADRPQTSKLYRQVGFVGHIIQSTGGSSVLTKLYYSGSCSVHTGEMLKLYWDTNNIFRNTAFPWTRQHNLGWWIDVLVLIYSV